MLLAITAFSGATVSPTVANLEAGNFSEFSQTGVAAGSLQVSSERAYGGSRSAKATYGGGGDNGYSRGIYNVSWPSGTDVWYGAAFYLPSGFLSSIQGQVDLMRWDNYPTYGGGSTGDTGGLVIYSHDKKARLNRQKYNGNDLIDLVGPVTLPEGRWFWVEVHQRLGATNALSELYLDGQKIGSSTQPNSWGRTIERIRYGIVAIHAGRQTNPLTVYFDRAAVGTSQLGVLGSSPAPAPAPEPEPEPQPEPEPDQEPQPAPQPTNQPPSVAITSPQDGSEIDSGRLTIRATASDDKRVDRVEFYVDDRRVDTDWSGPYSTRWRVTRKLAAGTHRIKAKAYDRDGLSATASVVVVK